MRYFLALSSLIFGVVLLLVGLGQRALFAGPAAITSSTDPQVKSVYSVLTGEQLETIAGNPEIIAGTKNGVIAVGSTVDVLAWVKPFGYTNITVDEDTRTLKSEPVQPEGEAPASQDVADADLWSQVQVGDKKSELVLQKAKVSAYDAVLIAKPDAAAEDTGITVSWKQVRHTPWVGPFLVVGGFFTLLGIALYVLFVDRDRRGLGPRRGRRGPLVGIRDMFKRKEKVSPVYDGNRTVKSTRARRARLTSVLGLGLVGSLALTGCSQEYWPQLNAPEEIETVGEAVPATVSAEQIAKIIKDVSAVSTAADKAKDASLLESRFAGPALEQRAANYKIRAKFADYNVVPLHILAERLEYELVQQTATWPRTIFVTVSSSTTEPTEDGKLADGAETAQDLALLLTQENAHAKYKVQSVIQLLGGVEMPAAAPAEEGTAVLDNATKNLLLAPQDLAAAYGRLLVEGPSSQDAAKFNAEAATDLGSAGYFWVEREKQALAESKGQAEFTTSAEPGSLTTAISTGAGGALVVTTVYETRTTTAAADSELTVNEVIAAVSDLSGKVKNMSQRIEHQLLFYVPRVGSDEKIQLLGFNSELVGASTAE